MQELFLINVRIRTKHIILEMSKLIAIFKLKKSLTADELTIHFTYRVKLVWHKIEASLSTDEFKEMQTSLKNAGV